MKFIVSIVIIILGVVVNKYYDFYGAVIIGTIYAFIYTWIEKSKKNSED